MSNLPPPPPYTPRDPNSPVLTPPSSYPAYEPSSPGAVFSVVDGFSSVANASPVVLTPPASPTVVQQNHTAESPARDLSLSSSRAYFESRPSPVRRPGFVFTNHITITLDATPPDIPFPPSTTWRARDVDDGDWATFLNHLFPQHHTNTNAQIIDQKIGAEIKYNLRTGSSNVGKLRSAQIDSLLGSSSNGENQFEPETERSKRIEAVIKEWNEGFFLPRGLRVVGVVQPFSSSSREGIPPSCKNTGCGRKRWGDRAAHNGFSHYGHYGCHGRRERRDNSHFHWNIDPNGSHGCRRASRRRRQGCGQNISSIPGVPVTTSESPIHMTPTGPLNSPGLPRAPDASGVPPYMGVGEAVRHTAAQIGEAARYTALQLSEAARLTGQQVEQAARSTASQVSDAARVSGAQLSEAGRLAGQQIEEAARYSAAQIGLFAGTQTRGAPTWNRTNTFGLPSPSPSSHRRQSTSSSSRSFPSPPSSLPSHWTSSHPHRDSEAAADVTELTNAMEALATSPTSERPDGTHTWNHDAGMQYKERARERKVEIREMKQELKQKKLEAKEEHKRERGIKRAMREARKSEKKMWKSERRNLKLKEKMEKAEIKLLGNVSVNVPAKGDDSLTPEGEWWKEKLFEEQ